MNASRVMTFLSIALLISWSPSYAMDNNNNTKRPKSKIMTPADVQDQMKQPLPATPAQSSPATPKQQTTSNNSPTTLGNLATPTQPEPLAQLPASPKPQTTQSSEKKEVTTQSQSPKQLNLTAIINKQKKPVIDKDSSWGSVLNINSSYIPSALQKLKTLKESKNTQQETSRVTHDCDWAINEIAQNIVKINENQTTKDVYTLRTIIDSAKPFITSLREIVDLVNETNLQLIDTKLRQVQDTFKYFDTLTTAYATLISYEISLNTQDNKKRKQIVRKLIAKPSNEDNLSDDEYNNLDDLNKKVSAIVLELSQTTNSDTK